MTEIPEFTLKAIEMLENSSFEAYIVGGCVRDFIMNIQPHDFDIASNALPKQIKAVFSGYTVIATGEKHGTVTVIINGEAIEITTYRIDGNYTDSRHPDKVSFSPYLEEDLKRRDFTINAMAMDTKGNITDLFGGRNDIKNGIIKAVGNAKKRFEEDALRILRALRFASRLGFVLDKATSDSVHECKDLLKNISSERIRDEFIGIILGKHSEKILRQYRDVIAVFIPEIIPCFEFEQHSPYHKYDVWEHTVHAVSSCANRQNVKLAMFFHDIAKPDCYKPDDTGRGHFKGHPLKSAEKAETIMHRLKFPKKIIKNTSELISRHSDKLESRYEIRRMVGELGFESALDLIDVQRADSLSKQDFCRKRLEKSDAQEKIIREIIVNRECISIRQLDVNGSDILKLGFCGSEIRAVLEELLKTVMKDEIENEHYQLISYAKSLKM